jgi:hypothetical protein
MDYEETAGGSTSEARKEEENAANEPSGMDFDPTVPYDADTDITDVEDEEAGPVCTEGRVVCDDGTTEEDGTGREAELDNADSTEMVQEWRDAVEERAARPTEAELEAEKAGELDDTDSTVVEEQEDAEQPIVAVKSKRPASPAANTRVRAPSSDHGESREEVSAEERESISKNRGVGPNTYTCSVIFSVGIEFS